MTGRFRDGSNEAGEDEGVDEDREWITIAWVLDDETYPDETIEDRASDLAELLEVSLEETGAGGILGMEMGPGVLEIHIEATSAERSLAELCAGLVTTCRDFGSPEGSTLTWFSSDRTESKTSDVGRNGLHLRGDPADGTASEADTEDR